MLQALLAVTALIFAVLFVYFLKKSARLGFEKRSLSSRYGKMSENFMPFMKTYPYDPEKFRFLGNPVDGVQFNDDDIVFIEFKTAGSNLSQKQRKIREIIEKKKIRFQEIKIK